MSKEKVQAYLFTDNTPESNEARILLNTLGISFREVQNNPDVYRSNNSINPPALISREGDFNGLRRIREFIDIVTNRPSL